MIKIIYNKNVRVETADSPDFIVRSGIWVSLALRLRILLGLGMPS